MHDLVKQRAVQEQLGHQPALLHRLDRVCSGVMVFGKSKDAERYFQTTLQHEHDRINKIYLAVVHGKPERDSGVIRGGIMRTHKNKTRFSVVRSGGSPSKERRWAGVSERATDLLIRQFKPTFKLFGPFRIRNWVKSVCWRLRSSPVVNIRLVLVPHRCRVLSLETQSIASALLIPAA